MATCFAQKFVSHYASHQTQSLNEESSVQTIASDELYIILKTLARGIQAFYGAESDFLPDLFEDLLKLAQEIVFQCPGVYRTIIGLVHRDFSVADSDIRDKTKLMSKYSTQDFGIDYLTCIQSSSRV